MLTDGLLTIEQRSFATAIGDFCRRECGTRAQREALTEGGVEQHSPAIFRRFADLGWLSVLPGMDGGGSITGLCILATETARGMAPVGALVTTSVVTATYGEFGTPEQRADVLGGVASGNAYAVSISEPEAGSDAAAVSCKAARVDGGWVIDGHKTWCTNAHLAESILVVARTSTGRSKHEGLTMFQVPTGVAGLSISPIDTLGGRDVNDLYFTGCFLPDEAVVGAVSDGWMQLSLGLDLERLLIAAVMLGVARRALDETIEYVKQRRQFGQAIGSFQALRHRLSDLATEVECSGLLVHRVAQLLDEDPEAAIAREAAMAKLKSTETAKRVALECLQMMGGYGYATEYDMQRHLRSALGATIYGGSSEIQREIIGNTYGL